MTDQRGWIFREDAYAQGKMLDHSGWNGILPRRITPSDVDAVWDNSGKLILAEFSRSSTRWRDIRHGQRLMYENSIKGGAHCACLCKHSVPSAIQIDTRRDIDSFEVMIWDHGLVYSPKFAGSTWENFVLDWFKGIDGPLLVRRKILGQSTANGAASA